MVRMRSPVQSRQLASNTIEMPCLTRFFPKVFSYFCPKFALIVKKSLDMNVYYGRIGLRNMKGVKQMNKQLVIQQAIFYHTLLSKQENKAH